MPIRIPQIVSQQGLAAEPGPRLDPSSAASIATGPARALGDAAATIAKSLDQYNKVNQKLTEQDMKLDQEAKLADLKDLLAQTDIGMREEGVEPDALPSTMQQRGAGHVADLTAQLKYPASAGAFQAEANKLLLAKTTEQRYEGLKRKEARISINAAVANQDLALAAVNASTPELRAAAMQGVEDNVNELVTKGIWSAAKGESEILQARTQVVEGRVIRQFDTPGMQTQTIVALRRGQVVGLSAVKQGEIADKLENKERAEETRLKTERKEAQKAVGDEIDRNITDLLVARKFGEARLALATDAARFIDPARYSTLSTTITTQENKETPSNPITLRRLTAATHSITTDPKEVLADLQQQLADGMLTTNDFNPLASHVEVRIKTKADDDPLLARKHAQVEQNLKTQLAVTGPAAPILNSQAQDVLALAMEDLSRNSSYFRKDGEDPFDWEERRKAFYIARIGVVANQRLNNLSNQMRDGNGVPYATGDPNADKAILRDRRGTFRNEADFYDQVRLLRESANIRKEIESLKGRASGIPTLPAPATPAAPTAPTPSGPGGGKTLGRTPPKG